MSKQDCDRRYYERNKERIKARATAYYHATKETRLAKQKERYSKKRDEIRSVNKEWANKNRNKMTGYHLAYVKRNRSKWTAQCADYRARKRHATPVWANEFFIAEAYALAAIRTEVTGVRWEVDHVVPLRSSVVCGLHSHTNIQVIPRPVNRRKSNKIWPGMP